jgi:hypothetical protein
MKKIYFLFLLNGFSWFSKPIKKFNKIKKTLGSKVKGQIIKHDLKKPQSHPTKISFKQKIINFFTMIWETIKNLWKKIKELLMALWNKIFKKKEKIITNKKERIMVKTVTTSQIEGVLINKTNEVNGYLRAKNRLAISIPYRMENFKIKKILPDNISWVKKGDVLVEFDVNSLKIQKKYNQEQINDLEEIASKEKELFQTGGLSKKESLDIISRLNKVKSEQDLIDDQLRSAVIKAPFSGIITRPEKNEIGQNARTKRGDLFILENNKNLLMEAYISSNIFDEVHIDDEVVVNVFLKNPQSLKGKIVNKEQFSDQNTGLFKIIIEIVVEENNNFIGQPSQALIKSKRNVYLAKVPEKSVFFDNGEMAVFLVIDNHSVKRNVVVENAEDNFLYVSGLPKKFILITDEANVLNNGDLIMANKTYGAPKTVKKSSEDPSVSKNNGEVSQNDLNNIKSSKDGE